MLKWYNKLKITLKLKLAFAAIAAITVIVGLGSLWMMSILSGKVDTAYNQDLPAVSAVKDAGTSQLKAMRALLGIVLAAGDDQEIDKANAELTRNFADERKEIGFASARVRSQEGKQQLGKALKRLPAVERGAKDIVTEAKGGDIVGFRNSIKELIPMSDEIQRAFDQVSQVTQNQAKRSRMLASAAYWSASSIMLPLVLGAALLASAVSFIMSNIIAGPLTRMVAVLQEVAKGDLTQSLPVHGSDETAQVAESLNDALASIRATLLEVGQSSTTLKSAAKTLASTAGDLARGASTQAAGLESTTASLEQISVIIRNNAAHSERANELGASAQTSAELGGSSVQSAIDAMEEIRKSSGEITKILAVINELSFQSNLLAVNASIEAAHAGESGRSFAVVASEIRSLAQRSADSAHEIERLITNSLERVANGSSLVNRSGEALAEIIDRVKTVSGLIDEMTIASKEQSLGVAHITESMTRVDVTVQAGSSKAQALSATAEELAGLASGLNDAVNRFVFSGETRAAQNDIDDLGNSLKALKAWISSPLHAIENRTKRAHVKDETSQSAIR